MRRFIALLLFGWLGFTPATAAADLMVGFYPNNYIYLDLPYVESNEGKARAAGSRFHLLGDFIWIQDDSSYFINSMEAAWQRGSIPLINVLSTVRLRDISYYDKYRLGWAIVNWASQGGGRRAYIVLFAEMNGSWAPGFDDGPNSVATFQNVAYTLGLTGALPYVKIVWGPSDADVSNLQAYYPGPAYFDVAGVSSYNFGTCDPSGFRTYDQAIAPAFQRLRTVAPGKPLLLAQTGVGTAAQNDRQEWARTLVSRLLTESGVIGFAWYNTAAGGCNYALSPDQWGYAAGAADWRR